MAQTVTIPDDLASLLGNNPEREVVEALLVKLFREGKIGSSRAAGILGLTRADAIRWLGERGAPCFDQSAEELNDEVNNATGLGDGE